MLDVIKYLVGLLLKCFLLLIALAVSLTLVYQGYLWTRGFSSSVERELGERNIPIADDWTRGFTCEFLTYTYDAKGSLIAKEITKRERGNRLSLTQVGTIVYLVEGGIVKSSKYEEVLKYRLLYSFDTAPVKPYTDSIVEGTAKEDGRIRLVKHVGYSNDPDKLNGSYRINFYNDKQVLIKSIMFNEYTCSPGIGPTAEELHNRKWEWTITFPDGR